MDVVSMATTSMATVWPQTSSLDDTRLDSLSMDSSSRDDSRQIRPTAMATTQLSLLLWKQPTVRLVWGARLVGLEAPTGLEPRTGLKSADA